MLNVIGVYNNRTDHEHPCNVCQYNVSADNFNDEYGDYWEAIERKRHKNESV